MKAFANYHPAVLLVYFISVLGTVIFVSNPVLQITALLGGILFSLMLQKRSEIPGNIGFYTALFLMAAILNPMFSHNGVTPLFFLNGNPVTYEAIIRGIAIAVMIVGFLLWCKCYSEIMTSDKFLYLFGKAIPRFSLILAMILRFVPMFKRRWHSVKRAQKAMGFYSTKSYVDRIRNGIRVFSAMIAWTFENTLETSLSMKARGYGIKGRTNFTLFRFYAHDAGILNVCVLLAALTAVGSVVGEITFYYYPRITQLSLSPFAICVYVAFGALSFLPFFIEVKEALVWKYCVSKI